MSDPSGRDLRWCEQIKRGDRAAFEALFRAYYDELCGFAWRYVQSTQAAEDIVQDVLMRLWLRRESLNIERTVKTYLYGAVRNEALKQIEHLEVVRRSHDLIQAEAPRLVRRPDEELDYKQLSETVEQVVSSLPERRREIFILHRQHGFTYREIADLLGISVATVETQIGRSLDALRKLLASLTVLL